jgi:nucleoside-diphosphate-sugar epimerase
MTTNQTVLIAGATGNMGSKIATALAQKEGVKLRALVRSQTGRDERQQQQLAHLQALGIELVEGDLNDFASLERACSGVDTVLSAVNANGNPDVELTGQLNLLNAAKTAEVSRFMPSDYSADYTKLQLGDHHNYDFRIQVAQAVKQSGLNYTFIMSGAFMEVFFAPFFGVFDFQNGTVEQWGDGNTPLDLTTMDDAAKYTAEAVVDSSAINTAFQFAGDVITMNDIVATYQNVTYQSLNVQHKGSIAGLKTQIEALKNDPNPWSYIRLQYLWIMESGIVKLEHLVNDRYPNIHPTSVEAFFRTSPLVTGSAATAYQTQLS